jgi:hypothetical protein
MTSVAPGRRTLGTALRRGGRTLLDPVAGARSTATPRSTAWCSSPTTGSPTPGACDCATAWGDFNDALPMAVAKDMWN